MNVAHSLTPQLEPNSRRVFKFIRKKKTQNWVSSLVVKRRTEATEINGSEKKNRRSKI